MEFDTFDALFYFFLILIENLWLWDKNYGL